MSLTLVKGLRFIALRLGYEVAVHGSSAQRTRNKDTQCSYLRGPARGRRWPAAPGQRHAQALVREFIGFTLDDHLRRGRFGRVTFCLQIALQFQLTGSFLALISVFSAHCTLLSRRSRRLHASPIAPFGICYPLTTTHPPLSWANSTQRDNTRK